MIECVIVREQGDGRKLLVGSGKSGMAEALERNGVDVVGAHV
jgi:hypothetical protein